ncbi:MAG: S9 family peptidase, partial [Gemmatimonadota bacterium]|nr:S9 family peptidase [Gemmatimonadota bacterium]
MNNRPLPIPAISALVLAAALLAPAPGPATAQEEGTTLVQGPGSANFELAARFAPYKVRDLLHSTRVQPRWVGDTQKFWYQWENSGGTHYYLVDPERGTKTEIFDNDRIAAELTRITRDPWDAQHLPIRAIRFIDEGTIQFDVQSSQEEEVEEEEDEDEVDEDQEEEQERGARRPRMRPKVHHFEYDVATRTLRELEDYEEPRSHPFWASISPDTAWVVFSREFNLWMMSY